MSHEPQQKRNRLIPQYRRVRTVKLVGGYLHCDCHAMDHIGICCPHILGVTNSIHESCFTVRWWNDFTFYYGREAFDSKMDPKITKEWDKIAFDEPRYPGVLYQSSKPNPEPSAYPVLCQKCVPLESFLAVKNSPVPVLTNCSKEAVAAAMERTTSKSPPIGLSQELHGPCNDGDDEGDESGSDCYPFFDDDELCANHSEKETLYNSMLGKLKDICRFGTHYTPEMEEHFKSGMNEMLVEAYSFMHGQFVPSSLPEEDANTYGGGGVSTGSTGAGYNGDACGIQGAADNQGPSRINAAAVAEARGDGTGIVSIHLAVDDRPKDVRIKQPWERKR